MKITVFTAFSGYDAQCMALDHLKSDNPSCFDYELVGWSEIDKAAIASHNAIYPQYANMNYGDISKINWYYVPDFDLFTYSSPCIDFSISGKKGGGAEGSGTKSSLLWECKKAIEIKRPKYCVFENVKNLTSKTFIDEFVKWLRFLSNIGYLNTWQVLNSGNYNNCQNRERVFVISIRKDDRKLPLYYFPERCNTKKSIMEYLESNVDERFYFSEEETRLFLKGFTCKSLQSISSKTIGKPIDRIATPLTVNNLVPTIMASGYEGATYKNMKDLSYFPKLGILEVFNN